MLDPMRRKIGEYGAEEHKEFEQTRLGRGCYLLFLC